MEEAVLGPEGRLSWTLAPPETHQPHLAGLNYYLDELSTTGPVSVTSNGLSNAHARPSMLPTFPFVK